MKIHDPLWSTLSTLEQKIISILYITCSPTIITRRISIQTTLDLAGAREPGRTLVQMSVSPLITPHNLHYTVDKEIYIHYTIEADKEIAGLVRDYIEEDPSHHATLLLSEHKYIRTLAKNYSPRDTRTYTFLSKFHFLWNKITKKFALTGS